MASEVTSGIDHRRTDPITLFLESQSAFQCLLLYPVVDRYDIVDFVKCVAWRRRWSFRDQNIGWTLNTVQEGDVLFSF